MAVQGKRFGWLRSTSGWEMHQAWQEKRKAMLADFEYSNSSARNAFANAWLGQIEGSANLAGQAALTRIQAESKAKLDKLA